MKPRGVRGEDTWSIESERRPPAANPRGARPNGTQIVAFVVAVAGMACGGNDAPPAAPLVPLVVPPLDASTGPASSSAPSSPADAATSAPATDAGVASTSEERGTRSPASVTSDPIQGPFTIEQATAGLPTRGLLSATIKTSMGDLRCRLFEDKAPQAVAHFVGLARGTRPFKDPATGFWVSRPAYDGTTFHRVIKNFMIQGGDPTGTGRGDPGFTFPDELWGAKHDRPGLLCMANRGPNTNGMQFFVTDAKAPHLDASYTILGECGPVPLVHQIASVPTGAGDRPKSPVTISTIEVSRSTPSLRIVPPAASAASANDAGAGSDAGP